LSNGKYGFNRRLTGNYGHAHPHNIGIKRGSTFKYRSLTSAPFKLDTRSGLAISASVDNIDKSPSYGVAKVCGRTRTHGVIRLAPGGNMFPTVHDEVFPRPAALAVLVTPFKEKYEDACWFSDRMIYERFGKLECTAPDKCSKFECPRARRFCKYNDEGRRLRGFEVQVSPDTNQTIVGEVYQWPTVGLFGVDDVEGTQFITNDGIIKPRLVESFTRDIRTHQSNVTPNPDELSASSGEECLVTSKMISDQCGVETCSDTMPPACLGGDNDNTFSCPPLPDAYHAFHTGTHHPDGYKTVCKWSVADSIEPCDDKCSANADNPCYDAADDSCKAKVLAPYISRSPFGPSELVCPEGSKQCSQGELTSYGFDPKYVQKFYDEDYYLTFEENVLGATDTDVHDGIVCSLSTERIKRTCGVQVCETVRVDPNGQVKDCGFVSTQSCSRETVDYNVTGSCPTNTCVDIHASTCFDINEDLQVDNSDATILFIAGNIPASFGGVEMTQRYMSSAGATKTTEEVQKMHHRVQSCRQAQQYSFTTGFREATDRFDFVALFIAVTIPRDQSGEALLKQKIKANFDYDEQAKINERYSSTIAAMKFKGIDV
jgi:hypothetical protein